MASFVGLVLLDGTPVNVNPEQVSAVWAVPPEQLPVGVADGCYVDQPGDNAGGGGRIAVQGTLSAVTAALQGGAPAAVRAVIGTLVVDMDTGTVMYADGVCTGATVDDTTLGTCVVTQHVDRQLPADTIVSVSPAEVPVAVAQDGPIQPHTWQVKAWDTTDGTADDGTFIAVLFAPVS